MSDLIIVAAEGRVRYFSHDGDRRVQQIADLIDPGLDITVMIEIGESLTALHKPEPKPKPERKPRAQASAPGKRTRTSGPRQRHGVTIDQIIDYLRAHPGSRPKEIGEAFGVPGQVINNRTYAHGISGKLPKLRRENLGGNAIGWWVVDDVSTQQPTLDVEPQPT